MMTSAALAWQAATDTVFVQVASTEWAEWAGAIGQITAALLTVVVIVQTRKALIQSSEANEISRRNMLQTAYPHLVVRIFLDARGASRFMVLEVENPTTSPATNLHVFVGSVISAARLPLAQFQRDYCKPTAKVPPMPGPGDQYLIDARLELTESLDKLRMQYPLHVELQVEKVVAVLQFNDFLGKIYVRRLTYVPSTEEGAGGFVLASEEPATPTVVPQRYTWDALLVDGISALPPVPEIVSLLPEHAVAWVHLKDSYPRTRTRL